jgi:hypothetical protein
MSNLPPTACRTQGCPNMAVKNGRCDTCQPLTGKTINDSYDVKKEKPFFKQYHSPRWKALRATRLRHNPICQVMEGAEQCDRPATVCHHIVDPKVGGEAALWDWKNIVCVCAPHHPGGSEGEKVDDHRNFADSIGPTICGVPNVFKHPQYASKSTAQGMSLSCRLAGLP